MKENISCPRTMSDENKDKLDASTNSNRTQDDNNLPDMATVFHGFKAI